MALGAEREMDARSKKFRAERGNRAKAGLSGAVASLHHHHHHHQRLQAGGEEMLIGTRVRRGPGRLDGGQVL